jgi:hypothetical protein
MIYIHDPKQPYITYNQAVQFVIEAGVEPNKAYLYLMALGVKGAKGRVLSDGGVDYLPAVKLAVKNKRVVTEISACEHCDGVIVK